MGFLPGNGGLINRLGVAFSSLRFLSELVGVSWKKGGVSRKVAKNAKEESKKEDLGWLIWDKRDAILRKIYGMLCHEVRELDVCWAV
jgi:hypothetical protein